MKPEAVTDNPQIRSTIHEHIALRHAQGLRFIDIILEYRTLRRQSLLFLSQSPELQSCSLQTALDLALTLDSYFDQLTYVASIDFFELCDAR